MTQHAYFHVGEIAIAHDWHVHPQFNGEEVTVIGGLEVRTVGLLDGGVIRVPCYHVRTCSGFTTYCLQSQLRKRYEPGADWATIRAQLFGLPREREAHA